MLNKPFSKSLLLVVLAFLLLSVLAFGQSIFGTLTGTAADASGAVIPKANVTLTNEGSGDVRKTVTNSDGYFTISSVPAGTYKVILDAPGFQKWETTGIAFNGSDKRNLDITMQVGTATQAVEVISAQDLVTPVDSGEKSTVLNTAQLQNYTVVGRSAAEFIKILPGFSIANTGTENRANFTGEVIGINGNGDNGSQSALNGAYNNNGLPNNSLDITADGAHVSDPGCNCATPVNPNTDMIQEVKVLTSNFSAENSKGPSVINTIAKAGTRDFHGEGYLYARHYSMNANDWRNNELGLVKPDNKYFFPGGNIGGPVLIPGTNFNKNRDKLFFFSGFEYFYQTLDTGILTATVPTDGMRNGDFSQAQLDLLGGKNHKTASGGAPQALNATDFPGGKIPLSKIDPSGQGLMNLFPSPNADPDLTGGYNYAKQAVFNQNGWQWMTRADYSISDNTKLFVRYNLQKETQVFPVGLWWRNATQIPYPTPVLGKNVSQSVSASLTHVFSPSLTNEFVFGYTFIGFPNVFEDPTKVDRDALNIPFQGVYKNGVKQIPQLTGWGGSEFATILNPGGFEVGGSRGLFADKYLPSVSDNITKVWGTHTMKFGFYYEFVINDQPNSGNTNGQIVEANWAGGSSGSAYGDLLLGRVGQYNEQNFNNLHNEAYHTTEFFGQDSWKMTRRLTVEYGLRVSHLGAWYDRQGNGFAVYDPSKYDSGANVAGSDYTGLNWHKRDSNVPLSGFPTPALFWAPRFGLAYDLFGTGKTVLRGGWGMFYYHNSQFTTGLDAPAGVQAQCFNNCNLTTFNALAATNPANAAIGTGALDPHDSHSPLTYSYSFTVSQRLPFASLLEVAYVGNQSKYGLNAGGIATAPTTNVNAVPYGALFNYNGDPNSAPYDSFRPLNHYQDLQVVNHALYQNYNALQVTWLRQRGRYNIQMNYSFAKNLGIVGADQFSLKNDYGPLANDRRHVFNAAYSVELGSPVRNNAFGRAVVNGWQLSGITQVQSGINLSSNKDTNGQHFNLNTNGVKMPGTTFNISARTITGTDSVPLEPVLTCDPTKNLGHNQFVNGSCFALPTTQGGNGPTVLPEIFGPAFFNSDLSLFKNFNFSESKKLQFRVQAYNFLNHPLTSFPSTSNALNLIYDPASGKMSNTDFGIANEKQGHRILQLAIKYYF